MQRNAGLPAADHAPPHNPGPAERAAAADQPDHAEGTLRQGVLLPGHRAALRTVAGTSIIKILCRIICFDRLRSLDPRQQRYD